MINYLLPLLSCTKYTSGLLALTAGANFFVSQKTYETTLSNVDQSTQRIVQHTLRECGLNPSEFLCKLHPRLEAEAAAVGSNIIVISDALLKKLNSDIENDKLFAISTLKHEIGHLHYKDPKSLFLVYASITGIAYIINDLAKRFLPPSPAASSILYSLGALTIVILASDYLSKAILLRAERRADDFAIQHATCPEELEAVAAVCQKKFQTVLDEARIHSYGVLGWKTVQIHPLIPILVPGVIKFILSEAYEKNKKPNQTLEDYVIENRNTLPIPHLKADDHHDNVYDLKMKFSKAAEKLRAIQSAIT